MRNLLELVVKLGGTFERLQLEYAVGGALAINYWGTLRATDDVDCLISIPGLKYQLFADEIIALGCKLLDGTERYVDVTVPALLAQARAAAIIETYFPSATGMVRVEFFLPQVPFQSEVLRRAVEVDMLDHKIRITSAEDMILLKLIFHRIKDLQDARGVLWVQRGKLDLEYIQKWSATTLEPAMRDELDRMVEEYSRKDA